MNPELEMMVGNLESMIEQMKQMLSGGQTTEETEEKPAVDLEDIEKILKEMSEEPEEVEEAGEVEEVEKSAEGATASDDAEEVVEDIGEVNQENINEVVKTVIAAMQKNVAKAKPEVKKSKETDLNKKVFKALEALAKENEVLKKGLENIYDGIGITDEIIKANAVQKSKENQRPMNDQNEIKKSIEEIRQAITGNTQKTEMVENHSVHKALTDNHGALLSGIFRNQAK